MKIKTIVLFYIICLSHLFCFAQNQTKKFILSGKIEHVDTGKVLLRMIGDSTYYPKEMQQLGAKINKGEFYLEGLITSPLAFEISVNGRPTSEMFLLDTGYQNLSFNYELKKSTPLVSNQIMEIDFVNYSEFFKKLKLNNQLLDTKWDSLAKAYANKIPANIKNDLDRTLRKSYHQNDSTLLEYVKQNPNSYYALWKLIRLTKFGYEEHFKTIYDGFSDDLKNSDTGLKLNIYLNDYDTQNLGKKLSLFMKSEIFLTQPHVKSLGVNKYTLIDFWYSNCGPCIAQFPDLKSIYESFNQYRFEIIGISTDKKNYVNNWQNAIKKYNLTWPQVIDIDGTESLKLGISVFPSNFLVNSEGKIVKINILPSELNIYLKNQLLN
jgi:thiol-disulfide isomerase/thioredoxin